MNQQQRAGKHPSFSRDRKPYGMRRETFRKEFKPRKTSRASKNKGEDRLVSKVTSVAELKRKRLHLPEWQPFNRGTTAWNEYCCQYILSYKSHMWGKFGSSELQEIKRLNIGKITAEIVEALYEAQSEQSWVDLMDSLQFQDAKEYLLRLAAEAAIWNKDFSYVFQIIVEITDRNLLLCILSKAAEDMSMEQFLSFVKMIYTGRKDALSACLQEALQHRQWSLMERLLALFDPSEQEGDAVLEAAAHNVEWPLVQLMFKHSVSQRAFNLALVKALEARDWDTVEQWLEHGGDMATACAENGFDMNAGSGREHRSVLGDAVREFDMAKLVLALLQNGADPDARDSEGDTVIHYTVRARKWKLVRLLLDYSQRAGEIASQPMPREGKPLLHILCEQGQVDLFQTLLLKGADPMALDDQGHTVMRAAMKAFKGRENLFRVLIQSGVSTHQAAWSGGDIDPISYRYSPMLQAVRGGLLRVAKMLYASGACSPAELHLLATSPELRESSERREMLDFLNSICSQPRSLLVSCSLKVSHLIGCGPQRDVRAASLGLPNQLRGLVLQDHVVNPDFLQDCPPDPPSKNVYPPVFVRSQCCESRWDSLCTPTLPRRNQRPWYLYDNDNVPRCRRERFPYFLFD